ncbi:hypothetical protein MHBO_002669, partial [Bonamia ostreae]
MCLLRGTNFCVSIAKTRTALAFNVFSVPNLGASPNCSISFHPSCSFRNKNRFIIKDKNFQIWSNTDFGSEILAEKFLAFCHKHNNENVLNVEKQTDFLFFRRTINYRESPNSSNSRTFIANKKKLEKPKIFLPLIWKNLESFFDNRLIIPILRLLNCSPKIDLSFAIPGQPLRRSVKMRILENFVKMPSFLGYREKMAIGISTDLSFCRIFRFLENFFCKSNSSIDEKKCVCEQCRNLNDSFADFINDFEYKNPTFNKLIIDFCNDFYSEINNSDILFSVNSKCVKRRRKSGRLAVKKCKKNGDILSKNNKNGDIL